MYRPVETEAEYFNNWVPKFNLMCKSQAQLGFFGSSFFIGVLFAISFVPRMSDGVGRIPFIFSAVIV